MRNTVSVFNKAQNVDIKNSAIMVHIDTSKQGNLERLLDEVAPNAILNAGGRADEVRCYPGTREEVIRNIEKWMDGEGSRMLWLSGPAGAGKSAIAQTIAERCRERGLHEANFFFFRGDGTRNRAQPLVATLAYQLRRFYPVLDVLLADRLTADPLICSASIDEQFKKLILSPIENLQHSLSVQQPIILIIDGLDECDGEGHQQQILSALRALANPDQSPFIILVASRAEPHLVMSFNRMGSLAKSIFLDDQYRPRDDIRRFIVTKFDEIKKDHHLAHTLSKDWPAKRDIDAITDKSSGQFVYAATVMRFIQYSSGSPFHSLLSVCGVTPASDHNPLSQLDALYSHIFSKARNLRTVKLILEIRFISELAQTPVTKYRDLLELVGYDPIEVRSHFSDLASIVNPDRYFGWLDFFHASLSDYLKDKSRSGIYYIDTDEGAAELSSICLGKFHDSDSLNLTLGILQYVKGPTTTLSESLLNASTRRFDNSFEYVAYWDSLLCAIERLYLKTDKALFKIMVQSWVRFAYRNNIPQFALRSEELSPAAFWYYKWYLTTERLKFSLRVEK